MIEVVLAVATLVVVALAAAVALLRRERLFRIVLGVATALAVGNAILRAVLAGHLPKFGTFEESLATAAVVLAHASWVARRPGRAVPAATTALTGGALLFHGLFFPLQRLPLTISERSVWLDLHVFAAWFAAAAFALATGGAVWLFALARRREEGADAAETLLTRALQVGFVFQSALMLLGAWYSMQLFGRAFSLDPIELLAVISWAVTASVLHLRAYRGLRGNAYAALGLVAAVVLFLSFRLIVHLSPASTYHVIDLDLRLHM